jgi:hypothetical protein
LDSSIFFFRKRASSIFSIFFDLLVEHFLHSKGHCLRFDFAVHTNNTLMSFSKIRPVLTRAAAAGGTVAVGLVAFPHAEDHYWFQKDPARVWDSKESILPANKLGVRKSDKKELVVLGTGWSSISVLQHIDRDKYNITVVSPRNYFLFTPLLPVSAAVDAGGEACKSMHHHILHEH